VTSSIVCARRPIVSCSARPTRPCSSGGAGTARSPPEGARAPLPQSRHPHGPAPGSASRIT
jgi:hypothetical protein